MIGWAILWSIPSVQSYEAPPAEVKERTIDSEISRLTLKMGLDETLVRKVIKCEGSVYGGLTHENKRKGVVWSRDWGPLQVNDFYHQSNMEKLGMDIHDDFDSLEYGLMLMKTQGLSPWKASKSCWSPSGSS